MSRYEGGEKVERATLTQAPLVQIAAIHRMSQKLLRIPNRRLVAHQCHMIDPRQITARYPVVLRPWAAVRSLQDRLSDLFLVTP